MHELIESKAEGREVVRESEPPDPTKVVDLFDALSKLSKSELETMARELDVKGRSKMSRAELEKAVGQARKSGKTGEGGERRKRAS